MRRLHPASDSVADVNASRLLRHAQVQSRVSELQAAQAEASQITAERLLAELEEARSLALSLALQLPFCFEVRSLSGSLVSSAPE